MVISPGVLASSPKGHLSIHSSGSGQLTIHDDQLAASGLTLWHTGSGRLQLRCSSISADIVDVTSRGRGMVALCTSSLTASDLSIANHSSGVIYVKDTTRVLTHDARVVNRGTDAIRLGLNTLIADELMLVVGGSGPILMSTTAALNVALLDSRICSSGSLQLTCDQDASSCVAHHIALASSGNLSTNVTAGSSHTNLSGSGCVRYVSPCRSHRASSCLQRIKPLPLQELDPAQSLPH
ncbi:hypothetical protein AeMF1_014989 [Aphanomyces euteiches]|nr:hypothetical protein AeMF1_014989 [Aphanomyces euteiches]KAH9194250.1 hypothetical protein AeNC1_003762 [Aphanomyces euteiches]